MIKMRYTGKGFSFQGIPARDLSADEVEKIGKEKILASGLYEEVKPKSASKGKKKISGDGKES